MGGQSSSNRRRRGRRRGNNYPQTTYPLPIRPPSNYYSNPPPPPPLPPPPSYGNSYSNQLTTSFHNLVRMFDSLLGNPPPQYHYPLTTTTTTAATATQVAGGWVPSNTHNQPSSSSTSVPQYVEHQNTKVVKNEVNIHKDTIRLQVDGHNPDCYLVSFLFDALLDGSVTVYYFAKEGSNCSFTPLYENMYIPTRVPFKKGLGQKFHQPSGSGIDLGFFELDDMSNPLHGDFFPLIIHAEASTLPLGTNEQIDQSAPAACAQITQAVIEKDHDGSFRIKVIKQILLVDGQRYELQEIFGLVNSEAEPGDDNVDDIGKECVICLSEPRNTAVLPCRHMCMCSDCAKALRLQSNKCPICRQPVERLMEIKVKSAEH